jgi:YD repeat-containing protein
LTRRSKGDADSILQETDPLGRVTSYTRDAQGYVTLEGLPGGATRQYAYQPAYPTAFHALTSRG